MPRVTTTGVQGLIAPVIILHRVKVKLYMRPTYSSSMYILLETKTLDGNSRSFDLDNNNDNDNIIMLKSLTKEDK